MNILGNKTFQIWYGSYSKRTDKRFSMIDDEFEYGELVHNTPYLLSEKKLCPGDVQSDVFLLLMKISGIRSRKMSKALYANLVKGESRRVVCEKYDINNGYLSTCLAKLEHINQIVSLLIKIQAGK
jgi:hypothetical protein